MEPISTAIIAALTAGAISGVTESAKKAINDAYSGLRALIHKKFGSKTDVTDAIVKLEAKRDPLNKHQSLKFSYSNGDYVLYGGNYESVTVAWQYGWLGRPK